MTIERMSYRSTKLVEFFYVQCIGAGNLIPARADLGTGRFLEEDSAGSGTLDLQKKFFYFLSTIIGIFNRSTRTKDIKHAQH
jgi:hypothetical protein